MKSTPKKITAWSFSRWQKYEECPLKAKLSIIDRIPEGPKGEALERGTEIHAMAETYVTKKVKTLPAPLHLFREPFAEVRKVPDIRTELNLAFDENWNKVGWFDPQVWVRVIIDLLVPRTKYSMARVIDHKTGRFKPGTYKAQLELYAIAGLLEYPDDPDIATQLWFLDQGKIHPLPSDAAKDQTDGTGVYRRADLPALQKLWAKRTKPMLSDTKFAPRPGAYCRWCPYSKAKAGICKF